MVVIFNHESKSARFCSYTGIGHDNLSHFLWNSECAILLMFRSLDEYSLLMEVYLGVEVKDQYRAFRYLDGS